MKTSQITFKLIFTLIMLLPFLLSCRSVSVTDYIENKPVLIPKEFFNGRLIANGIVKNRAGRVERYFTAVINASWKEGIGTLDEDFIFNDGEKQNRKWTLRPQADGSYIATAPDVIGDGILKVSGNSIFLDYVLRISYDGSEYDITIDDRMYLVSDNVLLNESLLTKWGFTVGSLTLVIEKQ